MTPTDSADKQFAVSTVDINFSAAPPAADFCFCTFILQKPLLPFPSLVLFIFVGYCIFDHILIQKIKFGDIAQHQTISNSIKN